jgi:hypothetical protein
LEYPGGIVGIRSEGALFAECCQFFERDMTIEADVFRLLRAMDALAQSPAIPR